MPLRQRRADEYPRDTMMNRLIWAGQILKHHIDMEIPEEKLIAAVFERAILDLGAPPDDGVFWSAYNFFRYGHFELLAKAIGLDPDWVLRVIGDAGIKFGYYTEINSICVILPDHQFNNFDTTAIQTHALESVHGLLMEEVHYSYKLKRMKDVWRPVCKVDSYARKQREPGYLMGGTEPVTWICSTGGGMTIEYSLKERFPGGKTNRERLMNG